MAQYNKSIFIKKAVEKHKKRYIYKYIKYKNSVTKIGIKCRKHGIFYQEPRIHLSGHGCPQCSYDNDKLRKHVKYKDFLNKMISLYGNKYKFLKETYSPVKNTKVSFICKIHGLQTIYRKRIVSGHGCPQCGLILGKDKFRLGTEKFIKKATLIHGDKYDYNLTNYVINRNKVKIICPIHSVFEQKPILHLRGHGCPKCNASKGELKICNFLDKQNIKYIREYTIKKIRFRYDFFLPDYNLIIEYHGKQHYTPVDIWGGVEGLKKRKSVDRFKKSLALSNKYNFLAIHYKNYDNIEKLISLFITKDCSDC